MLYENKTNFENFKYLRNFQKIKVLNISENLRTKKRQNLWKMAANLRKIFAVNV